MGYVPIDVERAVRRECERRRYSPKTAKVYIHCINKFLLFSGKGLDKISKADASEFLYRLSERGKSGSTINVYHMAIRFLFMDILRKNIRLDIKYAKVPLKLPVVLSKEEVRKLIDSIANEKHRLMVEFMYSAGLRVSELLNMKVQDVDLKNNYGFVREGKGKKDRIFILSQKLKPKIEELIVNKRGDDLLFISNLGRKYSSRSIQKIIDRAALNAGIEKNVHVANAENSPFKARAFVSIQKTKIHRFFDPHTLRHSFATHLIENGYSLLEVQNLLGHTIPETTMIYVHLAAPNMLKIKSPIDSL